MRSLLEMLAQSLLGQPSPLDSLISLTNLANRYLVTPQLYVAQSGFAARTEEERSIRGYWESVYDANRERNERLQHQLVELVYIMNSAGVVPVLLTGAAALASSAGRTSRIVADLDLMLLPQELEIGIPPLREAGYLPWERRSRRHTASKLYRPDYPGLVHIHHRPPDARTSMSAASIMRDSRTIEFGSGRARIPSSTDHLCYMIGHDMLEDRGLLYGKLNLRHALDALEIVKTDAVDWDVVRDRFASNWRKLAYATYLYNLVRLFGVAGLPGSATYRLSRAMYRRVVRKAEGSLYAALEEALFVLPMRLAFRVIRAFQSALQHAKGP